MSSNAYKIAQRWCRELNKEDAIPTFLRGGPNRLPEHDALISALVGTVFDHREHRLAKTNKEEALALLDYLEAQPDYAKAAANADFRWAKRHTRDYHYTQKDYRINSKTILVR